MANSSILGGTTPPSQPDGTSVDALGPSDSTDSGSDVQTDKGRSAMLDEDAEGALPIAHDSTTDASGTGERGAADGNDVRLGSDIGAEQVGTTRASAPDGALEEGPELAALESGSDDDEEDTPGSP
ncbi:MAG: hypothetical protein EOP81_18310 [Variovorax sp.]|nr:MAG: hypothetical protein EOP81_18310 [Variovorax sp.]